MTSEQVNIVVAGVAVAALVVLALAALVAALALRRMARDVRGVTSSLGKTLAVVGEELPQALKDLGATTAMLSRLADELPPRLDRIDGLLDEADASVQSLRATIEAAEDLVRGPAAAVGRARRGVRAAGQGLAEGADRLRRSVEERTGRRRS